MLHADADSEERGDSSYNVWILDLPTALPLLGRLVSDLYIRHFDDLSVYSVFIQS